MKTTVSFLSFLILASSNTVTDGNSSDAGVKRTRNTDAGRSNKETEKWWKAFGNMPPTHEIHEMIVGPEENIYIASFDYTVAGLDLGQGPRTSTAPGNYIHLASFDSSGAYRWAIRTGGIGGGKVRDMAIDSAGNLYLTGELAAGGNFGGEDLKVNGISTHNYLVSLTSQGVYRWGRGIRCNDTRLAVDAQGTVFLSGWFSGTSDFGGGDIETMGQLKLFIASYDQDGNHRWSIGDGVGFNFGDITTDSAGNIFVSGEVRGNHVDFSGMTFTSSTSRNLVLVSYDRDGAIRWGQGFADSPNVYGSHRIAADSSGDVVLTGFQDVLSLDLGGASPVSRPTEHNLSFFLAKYSGANGQHLWSRTVDSSSSVRVQALTTKGDNIYLAGTFLANYGPRQGGFGGPQLSNSKLMVLSIGSDGADRWSLGFGDNGIVGDDMSGFQEAYHLAIMESGDLLIGGRFVSYFHLNNTVLTADDGDFFLLLRSQPN